MSRAICFNQTAGQMRMSGRRSATLISLALVALQPANAEERSGAPQLTYSTRKGLDVKGNKIDRLLDLYGFSCVRNPFNPKPCKIETESLSLLKSMPPSYRQISDQLTALGAACMPETERLTCVYTRHGERSAWILGATDPETIIKEKLWIEFEVTTGAGPPAYDVKFHRDTESVEHPSISGRRG